MIIPLICVCWDLRPAHSTVSLLNKMVFLLTFYIYIQCLYVAVIGISLFSNKIVSFLCTERKVSLSLLLHSDKTKQNKQTNEYSNCLILFISEIFFFFVIYNNFIFIVRSRNGSIFMNRTLFYTLIVYT